MVRLCFCLPLLALGFSSAEAVADPLLGATLRRNDHVRVWLSDPVLMPTRGDGGSWASEDGAPKFQISIRRDKGTARTKVLEGTRPAFALAPFDVESGEKVQITLWEEHVLGGIVLASLDLVASANKQRLSTSSQEVLLLSARLAAIDVWSIAELPLVVPFRLDDAKLKTLKAGLKAFHIRLAAASGGQIRIEKYRVYEMPAEAEALRLAPRGVSIGSASAPLPGTPMAPGRMHLAAKALADSSTFADSLFAAFEIAVLGANSPLTSSAKAEVVADIGLAPPSAAGPRPLATVDVATQALPEAEAQAGSHPWHLVSEHFKGELNLELIAIAPGEKTAPARAMAYELIRPDTVDLANSSDESAAPLEGAEIKRIVGGHAAKLGKCMHNAGARRADISLTVSGKLGRVSQLAVNGLEKGPLHACLRTTLEAIAFPIPGATQTHARFVMDI